MDDRPQGSSAHSITTIIIITLLLFTFDFQNRNYTICMNNKHLPTYADTTGNGTF